jgi:membrane fusion protein (multidrug efflux system)
MLNRRRGSRVPHSALALAVLGLFAACQPAGAPPVPPKPAVDVVAAQQRDEPIVREWIGSVAGLVDADIRAQVAGYLMRQDYADGAVVRKGQPLFEIDRRTFQAAYDQAKAAFDKAQVDWRRTNLLIRQHAIAQQDFDNAVAERAAAVAGLEQARLNLDFTQIVSPIDGLAAIATAQIGDLVGPTSGILTTVSTVDPIKVYFSISEQEYLEFSRQGPDSLRELTLTLLLADGSEYPRRGRFLAADRGIDPATGTLRIAAAFPNPDRLLRPGQYARVRAVVRIARGAVEVPQQAVIEIQGTYQVAVVKPDGTGRLVDVAVGERVGHRWIIARGLQAGDRVVVEGVQKVRDGTAVTARLVDFP